MAHNKRQLKGGWLAILLVILLLVGLVVSAYLLSGKVAALKNTEKSILMFNAKENNFETLEKSVESLSEDKKIIEDYFITDETLPGFIEQLEKIASFTGVALEITSAAMTTGANPVMRLNFEASGTFLRLFQFASLVDSLPYVLDLARVSFNQGGDKDGGEKKGEKNGSWNGIFNLDLITINATPA